jgi:hypothetical protein
VFDEYDEHEVNRPVPRDFSEAQLSARGRRMTNLKEARAAVKAAVQPGDSFIWPKEKSESCYVGVKATIDRFQDEWCWVRFDFPDGRSKTQNIGFRRVRDVLKLIGKIS